MLLQNEAKLHLFTQLLLLFSTIKSKPTKFSQISVFCYTQTSFCTLPEKNTNLTKIFGSHTVIFTAWQAMNKC